MDATEDPRPDDGGEVDTIDAAAPDADGGDGDGVTEPPESGPSLNTVVAVILAIVGLRIGLEPLFDNSFFTHLATGRIILDGGIPRVDPYSFSAPGTAWTVQSWGASTIYALIDQAVGLIGIRVLVAACCVALTQLVWRFTSTAVTLSGRLLVAVPVVAVGWGYWVERPLLLSLVLLMAVLFALEDRLDPRWLIPVMWVWVNVHGSFPLALVAIGVYGAGRLLDRERPTVELRVLAWTAIGTVLGGLLNPLGWRLLVFPAQLLQRREAFANTLEWQPPTFSGLDERLFLIQLLIAVALVLSRNRRWRNILPVLVFGALSLQASRNIVHASLMMLPAVTAAAAGLGTIDGRTPRRILRPVQAVLLVLFVLVGVVGLRQPDADLSAYPVASAQWMRQHQLLGPRDRVLTRDFVGNYLELRYGPDQVKVFFDDRVDMYPRTVIDQYHELRDDDPARADKSATVEEIDPSAVLWDTDSAFGDWLEDPGNGWTIVHREPGWIVAVPEGSGAAGG